MSLFHLISSSLRTPTLHVLLQTIINRFLSNSYCLTVVSDHQLNLNLNLSFTYLIPATTLGALKDQLFVASEQGCSDYIVNMKDQEMFMTAFDLVSKSGNIRRSNRKIIFLPVYDNYLTNDEILKLFSMNETNYIVNVLMILLNKESKSNCDIYDLFTHKFIGSDEDVHQPMFLDQWNSCSEKFKINADLFPHRMNNLLGKTLKVAAFTYKPYVLLDLDTSKALKGRDGLELRIVEEFCRWVNCTIEIVREDEGQWGQIFENNTGNGVIGGVFEDRADIGIGALYSWFEVYIHLDFSSSIIRSAVTCVAPSPRLLASWTMPLMPFTWNMWYAVLITFILASFGLVVAKGYSFDGVFITIFGLMIAQSQKNAERGWRVRSVTGWLLVAGLILISAYGGGLASTFTVPKYEAPIDTVRDLVNRKLEWGATHDAWIFSLTLSQEPLVKQLVSQFRIYSAEELKRKSFTRSMGFSIEKLPAGYFAIGDYLTQEALVNYSIMLEDFYYEQCVIIMRKSSPYTEKLNQLIRRLHQSGLMLSWETQVALNHLNFKAQQEVRLSRLRDDVGFKKLGLRIVVGIFILYAIGVLASILQFLRECSTRKKQICEV